MMKKRKKLKKWNKYLLLMAIIFIAIVLMHTLYCQNNKSVSKKVVIPKITTKKVSSNKLSMTLVGDCLIHSYVYKDALNADGTYSFSKMFTEVASLIKNRDLAYYNQESNIGGSKLGISSYPRFNSPNEIGTDMVEVGFNMVSLANNHTLDKGEEGVLNSVAFWKTFPGVYTSGEAASLEERNNIRIEEKNGIKYAMLSYTTITNGLNPALGKEYLTNVYSNEKAKSDIDRIKNKVDLIIVAMHWGEEYYTNETAGQREIANYLSSLGVNLIVGNHSHLIQPVQMVNDTLVFYSLGNFISAQDTKDKLTGALINLDINKKNGKIEFSNIKANLIYTSFSYSIPRNFKIYPYTMLNNNILKNYELYYNKYKSILNKYTNMVEVVNIND
ncbi:MAG: CapA family protein [Bacilli bacterium]